MIRANLLPRPKETVALFGTHFDVDYLRQVLVGVAIVLVVTLIGIGVEHLRVARIAAAAADQEAILVSRDSERVESKALALDVARYQEIAREEDAVRRSGMIAAVSIARIGNAVPDRVWLDSLGHDASGYEIAGGSHSVDALGGAMFKLTSALPGHSANLISIENRDADGAGIHFTARIANPKIGATP